MVYDRRMIQITITYRCRVCSSTNIVRNGTNKCGSAQYYCKDCGATGSSNPRPATRHARSGGSWTLTKSVPVCGG